MHDRVNELYYRKIFAAPFQEECRRRIDWIVATSRGPNIVDLGCSQGITCVLLVRQGFSVTGIDLDHHAINRAKEELASLPARMAGNVQFIEADFFALQPEQYASNTVILSEVIEHFDDPKRVILHALRFLRPDGRIIITTPFGYKPSREHKSTFTLCTLLQEIPDTVEVVELSVADSFIRMIGIRRAEGPQARPSPQDLLRLTEYGILESQRILWSVVKLQGRRRRGPAETLKRLEQEVAEAKALSVKRLQATQARMETLQTQLAQAKQQLSRLQAENKGIRKRVEHRVGVRRLLKNIKRRLRKIHWGRSAARQPIVAEPGDVAHLASGSGSRLRAAAILDEFTYECFKHEFDIVLVPRTNWRSVIELGDFDFLFVESAWRGNRGNWNYVMSQFTTHGQDLCDLVNFCREKGIKTIFWNKEDPVNFDTFIHAALLFDWIFTVDQACVDRYREFVGHNRIVCLPFAAQSAIHNPLGNRRLRSGRVCFAGSWRGDKYSNRNEQLSILLQPALELGVLDIYDRYASDRNRRLRFPEPYAQAVVGSLAYLQLVQKYRTYDAFLNVNSVEDSPSMLSRRVFEILACGTPVISTPSRAIEKMLGETVLIARSAEESRHYIRRTIEDPQSRDRLGQLGLRKVLSEHTYRHRADTICKTLGFPALRLGARLVSIVCSTRRPGMLEHAITNVRRQTYKHIEVVFVLNANAFNADEVADQLKCFNKFKVIPAPSATCLGECLNLGLAAIEGDLFAKFDDDDWYGPSYLEDLILAQDISMAPVVGKGTYYCYLEELDLTALRFPRHEFQFTNLIHGSTILADRKATEAIAFEEVAQGTDTRFLRAAQQQGIAIFSADRFNFIHHRRASLSDHTWKITAAELFRHCDPLSEGLALDQVFV